MSDKQTYTPVQEDQVHSGSIWISVLKTFGWLAFFTIIAAGVITGITTGLNTGGFNGIGAAVGIIAGSIISAFLVVGTMMVMLGVASDISKIRAMMAQKLLHGTPKDK